MSARDLGPGRDDEGPALVRPYALVRGRTRTGGAAPIPVEAIVITTQLGSATHLPLERGAIVKLCEQPRGVAEVSALLHLPVGVVRVLVADLEAERLVQVNLPLTRHPDGSVDRGLLERVLAGLEAL